MQPRRSLRKRKELWLKWVEGIRRAFPNYEVTLTGDVAIAVWLDGLGLVNKAQRIIRADCVRSWRKRHDWPVMAGSNQKRPCFTTNLLLLTWLVAFSTCRSPWRPRRR